MSTVPEQGGCAAAPRAPIFTRMVILSPDAADSLAFMQAELSATHGIALDPRQIVEAVIADAAWRLADGVTFHLAESPK